MPGDGDAQEDGDEVAGVQSRGSQAEESGQHLGRGQAETISRSVGDRRLGGEQRVGWTHGVAAEPWEAEDEGDEHTQPDGTHGAAQVLQQACMPVRQVAWWLPRQRRTDGGREPLVGGWWVGGGTWWMW